MTLHYKVHLRGCVPFTAHSASLSVWPGAGSFQVPGPRSQTPCERPIMNLHTLWVIIGCLDATSETCFIVVLELILWQQAKLCYVFVLCLCATFSFRVFGCNGESLSGWLHAYYSGVRKGTCVIFIFLLIACSVTFALWYSFSDCSDASGANWYKI